MDQYDYTRNRFIFERPDELIKYINEDNFDWNKYEYKDINLQLVSPNLELEILSNLTNYTMLPLVLINTIILFIDNKINLRVKKRVVSKTHMWFESSKHSQPIEVYFDIFTDSFRFKCYVCYNHCTYYGGQNNIYLSTLHLCNIDNNILEYKVIKRKKEHCSLDYKYALFDEIFNDPDKYFAKNLNKFIVKRDDFKEYLNYGLVDEYFMYSRSFDCNLFFNCYSKNTQQSYNIIKHDSPCIKKTTRCDIKNIEDCKYKKISDIYEHVSVEDKQIKLAQYQIKNYRKLTNIISIIKLLYETINEHMKDMCNDYEKNHDFINAHSYLSIRQ